MRKDVNFAAKAIQKYLHLTLSKQQIDAVELLLKNCFVHMNTGQGKTLCILSYCIVASQSKRVHVVSFNDYLVQRDYELFSKVLLPLNISCAHALSFCDMQYMYHQMLACTVFICSIDTLAFFFLWCFENHINMHALCDNIVMDECDGVLVDKASVPFVLSRQKANAINMQLMQDVQSFCVSFSRVHFKAHYDNKILYLCKSALNVIYRHFKYINAFLLLLITDCLQACILYKKDIDYVVNENTVLFVDKITERINARIRFARYIHTFIELKENCNVAFASVVQNKTCVYEILSLYVNVCGISGTMQLCLDAKDIFHKNVCVVNDRILSKRQIKTIHCTSQNRVHKILHLIDVLHKQNTSVILVCSSLKECDVMYKHLCEFYDNVLLLNTKQCFMENQKIALAGIKHFITVTNNYFSRGIHVYTKCLQGISLILAQPNDFYRVDKQIMGRCGRDGMSGTVYYFAFLKRLQKKINFFDKLSCLLQIRTIQHFLEHKCMIQRKSYFEKSQTTIFFRNLFVLYKNYNVNLWTTFSYKADEYAEDNSYILFGKYFRFNKMFSYLSHTFKNIRKMHKSKST